MNSISAIVAQADDLKDGQMRQVSVGETEVLLTRVNGDFHALGATCTHYGAPLIRGVLKGERIVCPWHNACFHAQSGALLEPPGFDGLPCYPVQVKGQDVVVTVPQEQQSAQTPEMAAYDPEADSRVFVILGAGAAGSIAAETLRQDGFQGRVVMISSEDTLPYDRPKMSKQYLAGDPEEAEPFIWRSQHFYDQHGIELRLGQAVTQVDPSQKSITFVDHSTLSYDSLLLVTGGKPRFLRVPGAELENIFTLQSYKDAEQIIAAAKPGSQVVVIGSSFIGMEAAASLRERQLTVTVVSPDSVPLEKILGAELGKVFQQEHQRHGVSFRLQTKATQFEGEGKVKTVVLETGDRLPADLVVIGIGVQPVTDYLTGVERNQDQSLSTNEHLQVMEGLYAAGDIAQFPLDGKPTRIEHWRLAAQHGRIAADNMSGKAVKFKGVPFFWTGQFELKLRYVGHAKTWEEVIVDGDLAELKFIAYYIQNHQVVAVAGNQRNPEMTAISELMRLQQLPAVEQLRQGGFDPLTALNA